MIHHQLYTTSSDQVYNDTAALLPTKAAGRNQRKSSLTKVMTHHVMRPLAVVSRRAQTRDYKLRGLMREFWGIDET